MATKSFHLRTRIQARGPHRAPRYIYEHWEEVQPDRCVLEGGQCWCWCRRFTAHTSAEGLQAVVQLRTQRLALPFPRAALLKLFTPAGPQAEAQSLRHHEGTEQGGLGVGPGLRAGFPSQDHSPDFSVQQFMCGIGRIAFALLPSLFPSVYTERKGWGKTAEN